MPEGIGGLPPSSAATVTALHEETTPPQERSFWDTFSKLSVGQQIGRVFLCIVSLGRSESYATKWQQARMDANPRPRNMVTTDSGTKIGGLPSSQKMRFGPVERRELTDKTMDWARLDQAGLYDSETPEFQDLHPQFRVDCNRATFTLGGHDGRRVGLGDKPTPQGNAQVFKDFFRERFPRDEGKARRWMQVGSTFLNQNGINPAAEHSFVKSGISPMVSALHGGGTDYHLTLSEDGNSAIIEITQDCQLGAVMGRDGQILIEDPKFTKEHGIAPEQSKMKQTVVMRVTLDESPRGFSMEVLSFQRDYGVTQG